VLLDIARPVRIWSGLDMAGSRGYGRVCPDMAMPVMAGSDRVWPGLGRLWPSLDGYERLWPGLVWVGSGRLWSDLAGSWPVTAGSDRDHLKSLDQKFPLYMMASIDEDVEKSSLADQDDVGIGVSSSGQNKSRKYYVIQVEAKRLIHDCKLLGLVNMMWERDRAHGEVNGNVTLWDFAQFAKYHPKTRQYQHKNGNQIKKPDQKAV
nr:DNA/RNA helicase, DEAD/DEAH box type, N-terminal [Tanacetum cinerariifolium]